MARVGFDELDTESGCDHVRAYDGSSSSSTQLGSFSGTTTPSPVSGSGSRMFVTFTSDYSVNTSTGVQMRYTCHVVEDSADGAVVLATATALGGSEGKEGAAKGGKEAAQPVSVGLVCANAVDVEAGVSPCL